MSVPEDKAKAFLEDPQRLVGTRWAWFRRPSSYHNHETVVEVVHVQGDNALLVSLFSEVFETKNVPVVLLLSEFSTFDFTGTAEEFRWIMSGVLIVDIKDSRVPKRVYRIQSIQRGGVHFQAIWVLDPETQERLTDNTSGGITYHVFARTWRQATDAELRDYEQYAVEENRQHRVRLSEQADGARNMIRSLAEEASGKAEEPSEPRSPGPTSWEVLDRENDLDE